MVVLDDAGWHASPRPEAPDGAHLAFLPPSSPEPQPAERLWGPVDEPVANRTFADLGEPEGVLVERCRDPERQRPTLKARCRFHRWPRERRRRKTK